MRNSRFAMSTTFSAACILVVATAGLANAVEVTIVGAGFEEHVKPQGEQGSGLIYEGTKIYPPYGVKKWLNGNYNDAVTPKVWEADWNTRYQSIYWPDDQSGDPWDPATGPDIAGYGPAPNNPDGGAFEGDKTFRAKAYDGVEDINEFYGSYGVYQILDEQVKANHLYTMSVAVGTGAEFASWPASPDHTLELVVGGTTIDPERYDPTDEVVLATVTNPAVPAGTWQVETLDFNSVGIDPSLLTKKLQVRMVTNSGGDIDNPNTELYGHAVDFDDVRLTRYIAGDANRDDDVDVFAIDGSGDAQILSSNLGTTEGAVWGDGDFNGDGDVDVFAIDGSGDAQLLSSNLGSSSDAAADTAAAIYDAATGELTFDVGTGIAVIGIQAEGLRHEAVATDSALGAPAQNGGGILAYFSASGLPAVMASVGNVLPRGLNAEDIGFSFTPIGGESTVVPVRVVPEPSTIAMLLVLGAVALCWSRRNG